MTTSTQPETVVVAVDGSAASAAAVRWAAAEAVRRHARLHAVHVIADGRPEASPPEQDVAPELQLARETLPGRVGGLVFRHGIEVDLSVRVVAGDLAEQIAHEARDAALVVVGTPDGAPHADLPEQLADRCVCPVAMVAENGDATTVEASTRPHIRGVHHARP